MNEIKLEWIRIDSELYRAESRLGQVEVIKVKDGAGQPVWRALGPEGLKVDARLLDEAKRDAETELNYLAQHKPQADADDARLERRVANWGRYEAVFRLLPHPSKKRRVWGESMWDYYEWKLRAYPQFQKQAITEAFDSLGAARLNLEAAQRAQLDLLLEQADQDDPQPEPQETPAVQNNKQRPDVWLGKPPSAEDGRDAIHIAVLPAIADGPALLPGCRVGVCKTADGKYHASRMLKAVGIIDPFLTKAPEQGSLTWVLLFPYTITSLRHAWTHPGIDGKENTDV